MNNQPSIVRPIALTFLMALPFGFGVGLLFVGIHEGWGEYKREVLEIRSSAKHENRSLAFLEDGMPIVQDHQSVGPTPWQAVYTHLDGSSLTASEDALSVLHQQQLRVDGHRRRHPFDREPFDGLLSTRTRWRAFQDPVNQSIEWTWESLPAEVGGRWLVARFRGSDSPISYIAPDGFNQERPTSSTGFIDPSEPQANGNVVAFRSGTDLLSLNLAEKTVTTITSVDRDEDGWVMFLQNDEVGWRFAVQSSDVIRVFSDRGENLFEFDATASLPGRPNLFTTTDGKFVVTQWEHYQQEKLPQGGEVVRSKILATWLDESGKVTRTLRFENVYRSERYRTASATVNWIDRTMETIGPGLVVSEPAVMCGGIFVLLPWASSELFPERPVREAIDEVLEQIPYGIPVSALAGLFCAIACWRRQVRYRADWTKTWVIFVFLFGIAGLLAWRVHRRWPPMELVGLCEADFIGAEPNGLEIRSRL